MEEFSSAALFWGDLVSCSSRLHATSHILNLQPIKLDMHMLPMKYYLQNDFFQDLPSLVNLDHGGNNTSVNASPRVFSPIKANLPQHPTNTHTQT